MPKAWICKRLTFDAAHKLPLHAGPCRNLHGHTYTVEVSVLCEVDKLSGMGIDLMDLKTFLYDHVVAAMDHKYLNDVLTVVPTAENIAFYVLKHAERTFERPIKIRVFETLDAWVEVSSEED